MSTHKAIARNSLWYGVELLAGIFGALLASLLVANHFGPTRLAYYIWIAWLTNVTGAMGSLGLPMTVQKFAAEYFGRGDLAAVKAIYRLVLRAQLLVAGAIVTVGLALVWWWSPAEEQPAAMLLVLSILPRIAGFIPSQVNTAAQDMRANVPPTLAGNLVQLGLTVTGVLLNWGLAVVAGAFALGSAIELYLKHRSVTRRLAGVTASPIDEALRARMMRFSGEGMGLMALNFLVWDRSDVFFLKYLQPDRRQISFFSQPFTLADRMQMIPQMLAVPLGAALLNRAHQAPEQLAALTARAIFSLLVVCMPVLFGAAAVAPSLWAILYRPEWAPAAPVLVLMLVLSLPRAGLQPLQSLMRATERQAVLLRWGMVAGLVNVAVDVALVPYWGALGAAVGNGSAQIVASLGVLWSAHRIFGLMLPWGRLGRLAACAVAMAATAALIASFRPYPLTLPLAVLAGAAVYVAGLRAARVLGPDELRSFEQAGNAFPSFVRPWLLRLIAFTGGGGR